MGFSGTWKETVSLRQSVLCAGLDPPPAELGRGDAGLPPGVVRRDWALRYVEAVAPHCAAIKPNVQYWKGPGDIEVLEEVCAAARRRGLLVIEDAKLADIGSTNDAGFFFAARRADAVTFAPFAGNVSEAVGQAHAHGIGIIVLCLMSNPEYAREKGKRRLPGRGGGTDAVTPGGGADAGPSWERPSPDEPVPQYLELAAEARAAGADGVVVGAPSPRNHITAEELEAVGARIGADMTVLMPGVGAQGGNAAAVWGVFEADQVIVNAGRALMFPAGSASTPEEQGAAARALNDELNALRGERR